MYSLLYLCLIGVISSTFGFQDGHTGSQNGPEEGQYTDPGPVQFKSALESRIQESLKSFPNSNALLGHPGNTVDASSNTPPPDPYQNMTDAERDALLFPDHRPSRVDPLMLEPPPSTSPLDQNPSFSPVPDMPAEASGGPMFNDPGFSSNLGTNNPRFPFVESSMKPSQGFYIGPSGNTMSLSNQRSMNPILSPFPSSSTGISKRFNYFDGSSTANALTSSSPSNFGFNNPIPPPFPQHQDHFFKGPTSSSGRADSYKPFRFNDFKPNMPTFPTTSTQSFVNSGSSMPISNNINFSNTQPMFQQPRQATTQGYSFNGAGQSFPGPIHNNRFELDFKPIMPPPPYNTAKQRFQNYNSGISNYPLPAPTYPTSSTAFSRKAAPMTDSLQMFNNYNRRSRVSGPTYTQNNFNQNISPQRIPQMSIQNSNMRTSTYTQTPILKKAAITFFTVLTNLGFPVMGSQGNNNYQRQSSTQNRVNVFNNPNINEEIYERDPRRCENTCSNFCLFGYQIDNNGCNTCRCKGLATSSCPQDVCPSICPFGYEKNGFGCEICKCKPNPLVDLFTRMFTGKYHTPFAHE